VGGIIPRFRVRTTRPKIPPGLLVLGLAGLLAACAPPVRLATPSEVQQATRPSPTPAASANPNPSPGAGAGSGTAPAPSPSAAPSPPAGSGALGALQNELHQLIGAVQPSVVQIDTSGALGSGIVLDGSGNIVTNAHVLGSATSVTVTASDGTTFRGSVVGSFQANDLAVVRAANPTGSLKAATFGDSGQVEVGDIVLAMGSPLGLSDSVSEGIVSGLNRAQSEGNGVNLTGLVQTTAAIGPGNSGGALVDITGHVVGIPTLSASGSPRGGGGGANIGFAIPSNQVVNVTRQLVSGGTVTRTGLPFLGVTTTGTAANGAQVTDVVGGGPADKAGVQAGWVITGLDGHTVSDPSSISQILSGHKPGDRVNLTANLPDGSNRTVPITLGERPATTP
jgi:putative serine protease PepD